MKLKFIGNCLRIIFVCCLIGCSHSNVPEAFTYRYTMESIQQYKVEFQLDSDSTWSITRHHFFFDRYEGKSTPVNLEGKLTKDDWNKFTKLITASKLEKLDDSYGFDQSGNSENSVVYMVELKQNGKSKFVTVNAGTNVLLPDGFNRLVGFTGKFISNQMNAVE